MRTLKDVGMSEVATLRRRVRRQLAMGRIFPEDAAYIVRRLDEVESRIVQMRETNEFGEEEG